MSQFVESLRRLYKNGSINEGKVIDLCRRNKITNSEKEYILTN